GRIPGGGGVTSVRVWDLESFAEVQRLTPRHGGVAGLAFSPNGRLVAGVGAASVNDPATVQIWDAQTGAEVRTFEGHAKDAWTVAFSPDGRMLATGGVDRT